MNLTEINLKVKLRKIPGEHANSDRFSPYTMRAIIVFGLRHGFIFTDDSNVMFENKEEKPILKNGKGLRFTNWLMLKNECNLYFVEDSNYKTC